MKILAIGDIHGDKSLIQKVASKSIEENVDAIVICGDLSAPNNDLDGMIGPLKQTNKRVFLMHGNHDNKATMQVLSELYQTNFLHSDSYQIDDVSLVGCGGSNIGPEALSEHQLKTYLDNAFTKAQTQKKILITHNHPESNMASLSDFVPPSTAIAKAIQTHQPDIAICAHIHEGSGIEEQIGKTRLINVSKNPTIINL